MDRIALIGAIAALLCQGGQHDLEVDQPRRYGHARSLVFAEGAIYTRACRFRQLNVS